MIHGKVLEQFKVGGKRAILRYPRFEDLDSLWQLINSMVEERAMLGVQKKPTRKEEVEWLSNLLKEVENKETVHLVLEIEGDLVGSAGVMRHKTPFQSHTAELGIILRQDIRGKGIGKRLINRILEEARDSLKVKMVTLQVMGINDIAQRLYARCGFQQTGIIRNGLRYYQEYVDAVTMVKHF